MREAIQSLLAQGAQARRAGRSADANHAYAEAVELSREAGDTLALVHSLKGLGQILRDEGNKQEALERYEQAASLSRNLNDPLLYAHTIRHVADIQRELQQHSEAEGNYVEALTVYRSHPQRNTLDLANTLRGYAVLQTKLGKKLEAIALWQEAGQLYDQVWREPGSPYKEADLTPGIDEAQRQIDMLSAS